MNNKNVITQIITLTKYIFLQSSDISHKEQFIAGKQGPTGLLSNGVGISWLYESITHKTVEKISFMITSEMHEFSDCDHKSIQKTIRKTMREICLDSTIFHGDDVCFSRKPTLFECRVKIDITRFGEYILEAIISNIRLSISRYCIIYSPLRITGVSFSIESENLHIVQKTDPLEWRKLIDLGYLLDQWNPISENFHDGFTTTLSPLNYNYLFVVESTGTEEGRRFSASLKFRKLFSVIYSLVEYSFRNKVMAKPHSDCMQLPHKSSKNKSYSRSEIGELLPYYSKTLVVSENDVFKIKEWYQIERKLTEDQKSRIEKCSHFINKGMNTSDIDSYIHYFVALDALFGKRGSVFKSIEEGVNSLPCNDRWNEKISLLFDLRSELVHGGSRYIEEWPQYMKYYRHFTSEPIRDIEELAFHALAAAPKLFYETNTN